MTRADLMSRSPSWRSGTRQFLGRRVRERQSAGSLWACLPGGPMLVLVSNLTLPVLLMASGSMATESSPIARCESLQTTEIPGTAIQETAAVAAQDELPAFCRIRGSIAPEIGFEARLPLEGWNGKYYQSGCGGFCGSLRPDKPGFSNTINEALKLGYAAITTDSGHKGGIGDASWAVGNAEAVEVYAHRTVPLTHAAGTRMVLAFYGRATELDYFSGCSNGGRLAAQTAFRYPELFDGIIGGGPILELSINGGVYGPWVVQANADAEGHTIINRQNFQHKLELLGAEVLAQCDATDGSVDGMINLPRACEIDVTQLPKCAGANGPDCFTADELGVISLWYQGPRDSAGRQLYPGMPPGSERYWLAWFLDGENGSAPGNALGSDFPKYLAFSETLPEAYSALDFDFDTDPPGLSERAELLDAAHTDLRAFKAAGGKYLAWHGWQDPLVLPDQSVDWYEGIVEELGARSEVDPFLRLFMVPGMGHCWELPSNAPDQFNPITVLEDWVERAQPPDRLIVRAVDPAQAKASASVLCPYPGLPIHLGAGDDPTEAECAAP